MKLEIAAIEELTNTPFYEEESKPQGIVMYTDSTFLHSVHHNDIKSTVYQIRKSDQAIINEFDMPLDATHTSGLAMFEDMLLAVDYASNKIYSIDAGESLQSGVVKVIDEFATGLRGTSAISCFEYNDKFLIAVSDFLNSRKTYILDLENLLETKDFFRSKLAQYNNGWFSQGVAFVDGYIYESRNSTFGNSYIECRKISDIIDGNKINVSKVRTPLKGIEDLDFDGEYWWVSDEKSYKFYKITIKNSNG